MGVGNLHDISTDTNSNVTQLNLRVSCVESHELCEFLQGFPRLQSFTYSDESHLYERDDKLASQDALWIKTSLLAYCKATLQSLTFLAPNHKRLSFMGSLRSFEKLEEVYVEWSCLMSNPLDSGGPKFNEYLPESLVRLKIHDRRGRERSRYEPVIQSTQYAKKHRVQNLKWLIFEGWVGLGLKTSDRDLKGCLDMGITLVF